PKFQRQPIQRGAEYRRIGTVKRTSRTSLIFNLSEFILVNRNQRLCAILSQPRIRGIPHNRQQPGASVVAPTTTHEAESPHAGLLRDVFGVVIVTSQPSRQAVGGVEMRHDEPFKLRLLVVLAHVSLPLWSRPCRIEFYSRRNNFFCLKSWTV